MFPSGYQINPFTGGLVPDKYAERMHSKRLGPWAYAAPLSETAKLTTMADWFGYGDNITDGNKVSFNYDRTGRTLGGAITNPEGKISHKSADNLFDYMDDYKKHLDQYDPNYFHYDFQGNPGTKNSQEGPDLNAAATALNNMMTTLSGSAGGLSSTQKLAAGGRQTWNNPVFDALSKYTVR